MRKTLAAATVAGSLAVGGLVGSALGGPSLVGAVQEAPTTSPVGGWVQEALSGLVDDGTITQDQADAVATALEENRPERGPGGRGGPGRHLDTVAEALGMDATELRTALQGGQTIAEVAEAQGVDVATVVDALVADHTAHVQERVEAGELTQDEADARLADAEERATALVNGERPQGGPGHGPGPGPEGEGQAEEEGGS